MLKVLRLTFLSKNLCPVTHGIRSPKSRNYWKNFQWPVLVCRLQCPRGFAAPLLARLDIWNRKLWMQHGIFLRCSPIQTSATSNGALLPWTNRNRCLPLVQAILLMGRGPNKIFVVVALVQVRAWTTWDAGVVLKSQELQGANIQVIEAVSGYWRVLTACMVVFEDNCWQPEL